MLSELTHFERRTSYASKRGTCSTKLWTKLINDTSKHCKLMAGLRVSFWSWERWIIIWYPFRYSSTLIPSFPDTTGRRAHYYVSIKEHCYICRASKLMVLNIRNTRFAWMVVRQRNDCWNNIFCTSTSFEFHSSTYMAKAPSVCFVQS